MHYIPLTLRGMFAILFFSSQIFAALCNNGKGKCSGLYIIDDESKNWAGGYDVFSRLSLTTSTCSVDKYDGIHCNTVVDVIEFNRLPPLLTPKFNFVFYLVGNVVLLVALFLVTTESLPTRSVRSANKPMVKSCASLISVASWMRYPFRRCVWHQLTSPAS